MIECYVLQCNAMSYHRVSCDKIYCIDFRQHDNSFRLNDIVYAAQCELYFNAIQRAVQSLQNSVSQTLIFNYNSDSIYSQQRYILVIWNHGSLSFLFENSSEDMVYNYGIKLFSLQ